MAKVLTESEVATISYTSNSYESNRCCTKARAYELGSTYIEPTDAVSNQLITKIKAPAKCDTSIVSGSLTYNGEHQILASLSNIKGASSWYLCITTAYTIPATTNSTGVDWTNGTATAASASEAKTYYLWYRLVGDSDHTDIGVTYIGTKTIAKANSSIQFSTSASSVQVSGTHKVEASVLAGDGTVSYTSNNTSIATVSSNGTVTGKSVGSCTITATISATANYNSASASYTMIVYKPTATLTIRNSSSTYAISFSYKAYYNNSYHDLKSIGASAGQSCTISLDTTESWSIYFSNGRTINQSNGSSTTATINHSFSGSGSKILKASVSWGNITLTAP